MSPVDADQSMGGFHARVVDPNPQMRAGVLQELGSAADWTQRRCSPIEPAGHSGLKPEEQNDPAIRYIADTSAV